jgi:hypothetical protein
MNYRRLVLAIAAFAVATCCATQVRAEDGRVLEFGTNKPLVGVYVVAEWDGSIHAPVQSRSLCYHAEIATTDGNGSFTVATIATNPNPLLGSRIRWIYPYKPGYRESPADRPSDSTLLMEKRLDQDATAFDQIARLSLGRACDSSEASFLAARKAQAHELMSIARSDREFHVANSMLLGVERQEYGDVKAEENVRDREKARAKESARGDKP